MSAIGAIFAQQGVPSGQIEAMAASLGQIPHDAVATWRAGPVALAAAVLHTTAESREQQQPATSEDGQLAIAFDGYLLNPVEMREQLTASGARLRNRSDSEIALRAYETWGDDCAVRLEGEFSFIVADLRAARLFVARDHLGFLPLYYREERGRLIVASDLRTIAALSETPLQPNHLYLAQAISNRWCLREDTPWLGVSRALRAHVTTFDGERIVSRNYWEPPTEITIRYKREEDYVEHYREVLLDCLARASRSDAAVGVAVSGGLDSSALFCLADRLEHDGRWQAPGLAGYSLAAEEGGNAFELPYARAAAKLIGRPLTEVPLFDPDIDWYTEDARWHRDMPIPSNGAMMLDLDKRVVADGSRVLVNGSGGDEWLQGNAQYYRELVSDGDVRGFWRALRRDRSDYGWARATRQAMRQASAELTPAPVRRMIRETILRKLRKSDAEAPWLAPHLREALVRAEEEYGRSLPEHGIAWAKHNLVKSPFSDLTNAMMRRQRARIGLESRHPMLSRAFIEFSLRTPGTIKRQGATSKVVHRKAMEDVLPREILDRKTKANFTNVKIDSQFADYVRAHAEGRLGELCDRQGLEKILAIDFTAPEGDLWAWEIWGLYAGAAFLYQ